MPDFHFKVKVKISPDSDNNVTVSPASMCGEGNSTKNIGSNKRNICNVFLDIFDIYQHTIR